MLKERDCESGENSGSRILPCAGKVRFCTFVGVCYALLGTGLSWDFLGRGEEGEERCNGPLPLKQ